MQQPDTPHSHTHTQRVEDPEALAKHAIKLLEKRLANEFGLRAVMGAELEFSVLPHHPQEDYGVGGAAVKGGVSCLLACPPATKAGSLVSRKSPRHL